MKIKKRVQNFCLVAGVLALLTACGGDGNSSGIMPTNHQPTADAGTNQSVLVNAEVSLDGSNSKDPDSDALTYSWHIVSKPADSISNLTNPSAVKAKLVVDKVGAYVIGLIVKDGRLSSAMATMVIKVATNPLTNHAPIAQAGADKTANLGQIVNLDGSASSDADANTLTYQWTLTSKPAASTASLTSSNQVKTSLTVDKAGKYIASLVVNDGTVNSTADTVVIDVPTATNQAPTVSLGADRTATVNTIGTSSVAVAATSQDPNGDHLTYQWEFISKPSSSAVTRIQTDAQGNGSFIPDLVGAYELKITVSDGSLSAFDSILITVAKANNSAPIAKATDKYVVVSKTVSLDASASSDADNDTLSYKWALKSVPVGSNASLSSLTAMKPTLTADKLGEYIVDLSVSDGSLTSSVIAMKVIAQPAINALSYQVIDADYSKGLDKLVMISSTPNQLHIYDAVANTEQTVTLPLAPTSVSIAPDGLYAAVGHDAYVSYIDLKNAKLVKNLPVATKVLDIVLAANGYIYAFPNSSQWGAIYSINIANGVVTTTASVINGGTVAKLHPNGLSMYGANNNVSPDDIEKYDIQAGTASKLYDSPYHGDYNMCGNLWLAEEGKRIFTACGNVFTASAIQAQDMTYNGSLVELTRIKDLAHSASAGKVVAIPAYVESANMNTDVDTKLLTYDYEFLTPSSTLNLPYFVNNEQGFMGHGQFVFFNKAADTLITLLKADARAAMTNNYGVYTLKR
ncbi:MAG TPA: PKD domain-containing protein [Thiolinea sp.]|nr:PKD domain-containing protein [Thiolinea sp.]